jgi:hypothetical protein
MAIAPPYQILIAPGEHKLQAKWLDGKGYAGTTVTRPISTAKSATDLELSVTEEVYREEYTQYIEHNQKVNTQLLSQEQPQADGLLAPEPIEVPDASVEAIQINEQVQPIEEKLEIDELPYDMQRKNTNVV